METEQKIYDQLIGMEIEEKLWGTRGVHIWMKTKIPALGVDGEIKYYLVKNREKITRDSNNIRYIIKEYLQEVKNA